MIRTTKIPKPNERGSAIIIVLGVLALLTLMVLHISASSQGLASETTAQAVRSRLKYAAESAAAQAYWRLLCDSEKGAEVGFDNSSRNGDGEIVAPWVADGRLRRLNIGEYRAEIIVDDANAGIAVGDQRSAAKLRAFLLSSANGGLEEVSRNEKIVDVFVDYCDSGDGGMAQLSGMEQPGYEDLGYPHMPRNDQLQFREELLWIEGLPEFLGSANLSGTGWGVAGAARHFRIIPPDQRGFRFARNRHPALLSSTTMVIRAVGQLTNLEMAAVTDAIKEYKKKGVALEESLGPDLMQRVKRNFSLRQSGVVTFRVRVYADRDEPVVRSLRATRELPAYQAGINSQRFIRNWQKIFL